VERRKLKEHREGFAAAEFAAWADGKKFRKPVRAPARSISIEAGKYAFTGSDTALARVSSLAELRYLHERGLRRKLEQENAELRREVQRLARFAPDIERSRAHGRRGGRPKKEKVE
jgi:hypothetical protein